MMPVMERVKRFFFTLAVKVIVVPAGKNIGRKIVRSVGERGLREILTEVRSEYPLDNEMAAVVLAAVRAGGEAELGVKKSQVLN